MRAVIALKLADFIPDVKADFIGADKGALFLAKKGIHMKLAIGDFDSVEENDIEKIRTCTDELVRLNPVKDDSDSEAAIVAALERGYDEIWLAGATGGRMDHSLVNIRLAYKYPGKIWLCDDQNLIYMLCPGRHEIEKDSFPYISFFTEDGAEITLEGFRYPLKDRELTRNDLYTVSNEIEKDKGTVIVEKGTVLVMQCRDSKSEKM